MPQLYSHYAHPKLVFDSRYLPLKLLTLPTPPIL
jgi:hypothetical protein